MDKGKKKETTYSNCPDCAETNTVVRVEREYDESILIEYNCKSGKFVYPAVIGENIAGRFDDRALWDILEEDGVCNSKYSDNLKEKVEELSKSSTPRVYFTEYLMKNIHGDYIWYRVGFVSAIPGDMISITFTNISKEIDSSVTADNNLGIDKLTGLLNTEYFSKAVEQCIRKDPEGVANGDYAIIYFDILKFKAVNDIFGAKEGDRLLKYIADITQEVANEGDYLCHLGSDKFAIFTKSTKNDIEANIEKLFERISQYNLHFEIVCSVGVYITGQEELTVDLMIDRAVLAQSVIKGSYNNRYNYYTEELRKDMLGEQEIMAMMNTALVEKQFVVYFQPQYNHSTRTILGAEALVRWQHPEKGLISPGVFIPIFEKNGFIYQLDLYVFEQACAFLRKCIDTKTTVVPISTNFSRLDIFQPDFIEKLESIRKKYDIPVKYLHVEITESSIIGGSAHTNEIVRKLHKQGYTVAMDDFGSGYSSLNVLKDIDIDVIKLDMLFLAEETETNRGGTIVSSIVRMAKWLGMPVIAEGVETIEQADFLKSIGCDYVQGYLYSRPLPQEQYEEVVSKNSVSVAVPQLKLIDSFDSGNFWNPKSLDTLIFNNYVGGAAIFAYTNNSAEILRINTKYLQEIGMNMSEKDFIARDPFEAFDEENRKVYIDMLDRAISTKEETECETWREFKSSCCGNEKICIRTTAKVIGRSGDTYLFYTTIRNVTAEKEYYMAILDSEKRFKAASEQVNIYYWEYTVATKEMRPCFRCMRDLGLPALLTNYPDSAIERGIFPPEVADMYRDWHRQIEEGVEYLEAVIPLTMNRIPFKVKYTTEFDANGHPVKAYGSAILIQ